MDLKKSTEIIIEQLVELLNNLEDKHYTRNLEMFTNACIGNHVKHIAELYSALLNGYDTGCISYCSLNQLCGIEKDKEYAIEKIMEVKHRLNSFDFSKPLTLKSYLGGKEHEPVSIPTTFERELTYCMENTIHHMIIIRTGVCLHWPDMPIPYNFGNAIVDAI